jgi:peptidoglycan-associated lipoprotein
MQHISRIFIVLTVLFFTVIEQELPAQNRRVERADKAFELKQYNEAIELYQRAYRRVRRRDRAEAARLIYRVALSYKYTNNHRAAEAWFNRAVRSNYPDPLAVLYLADAQMQNAKYEDALETYQKYIELQPDDWRGHKGMASVETAQYLIENPEDYEVEAIRLFNSRQDDYTPAFGDHQANILIFASSRDDAIGDDEDLWTGNQHTSFFVSYLDRAENWSRPVLLDEGPINTEYNEGAPSVNASATEMYFTRCVRGADSDLGCRIFKATREGANWTNPQEVKLTEDSLVTVGHPAISPDDLTLYFVSNMEGNIGEMDIWMAQRETPAGEFGQLQNLGELINTPGNEMFPYVREDGTLYFASDGHPGLGGLDIFMTTPTPDGWTEPENVKPPINSSADDFGIVFKPGQESGFFSSNRGRAAVYDIHSFHLPPVEFMISGVVTDDSTNVVVPNAIVQLVGTDGSLKQVETDQDGKYEFDPSMLRENVNYEILVNKSGYFSARAQENTIGYERSQHFIIDLAIAPIPQTAIELPEILYDFDSWVLKPEFQDSLNGLVQTMFDNPNIVVELASHTDSRGTHEYNDTLSQRRAQAVVDFLVEQGIARERLEAMGYGKRQPRVVERDIERDGFFFEEGTELTEEFINSLPGDEHQEAAHQMNRRTEFRVLSEDYEPPPSEETEDEPMEDAPPRLPGNREEQQPPDRPPR